MPYLALEIPEVYDSITRPVTIGLVRDLIDRLGLPNDTTVHYQGAAETLAQQGSVLAAPNARPTFPYTGKVQVSMEETYLDTGVLTTAVTRYDNNYVFFDSALRVSMWPVYTKTEAVVSFRYRATNRTKALQWRDSLRRRMTQQQQSLLHEILYHYSPPPVFHEILKEIYRKRDAVAGYSDVFTEWLQSCYDPRLTLLSNLSGERGLLAIPEKQIQVQGWFSFLTEPDAIEKSQDGETWEVGFDHTIQYEKVTAMVIQYPISVHNQLLDPRYLCTETPYNPYNEFRNPSYNGRLNELFSKANYNAEPVFVGVRLPEYDDWRPASDNYKTVPIFTSLIGVDLDDGQQIVNLLDLGETSLTQTVANFIFRYRKEVLEYTKSVFHLTFYRWDRQLNPEHLELDTDLNLRFNTLLDPRQVYHFRLAVVTDLTRLTEEAREALRRDPAVCIQIFDLLDSLQARKLPFIDGLYPRSLSELWNLQLGWHPGVVPRPGFTLPSGDWSHTRSKTGQSSTDINVGGYDIPDRSAPMECLWQGRISNGSFPRVGDVFVGALTFPRTFSENDTGHRWPHQSVLTLIPAQDTVVVAVGPYLEGQQSLIAVFLDAEGGHYVYSTVNHFLQGRCFETRLLTEAEFASWYLSDEWSKVCGHSVLGNVYLPSGIYKPTPNTAGAIRISSPERPGNSPMLSDSLKILGGKVITKDSFNNALLHFRLDGSFTQIGQGIGMKTVMQAGIIAHIAL